MTANNFPNLERSPQFYSGASGLQLREGQGDECAVLEG
jgi:hypothetical protein